ncbi:MAG: WG repeat-containing protein, partial [Cytophagales bacterium]|nr:WG repeat-containing protein [Cytophagales bacterium]
IKSGWVNGEFDFVQFSDTATFIRVRDKMKEGFFNVVAKSYSISPDFDSVGTFVGGFSIGKKSGKYGVVDTKGTAIVPFDFQKVQYEFVGINLKFKVLKDGKYGIVDKVGKTIIATEYDLLQLADISTYKVKKGGKYGLLKSMGQPLNGMDYDNLSNKLENSTVPEWPAIVVKKGKYGLLANSGAEILEPVYNRLDYLGEGNYSVVKGKKIGLVDSRGNLWAEPQYESVGEFREGQIAVLVKGKWGVLAGNGTYSVQPEYDQYLPQPDGTRKLAKGGKEYTLFKGGKLK